MTRSQLSRILASGFLSAALLAGCGNDEKTTTTQSAYEAACGNIADAVCNQLVNCGCSDPSAMDDCKAGWRNLCNVAGGALIAAYPGVKFDPAKASACLATTAQAVQDCKPDIEMPDCLSEFKFVTGMQAQGEYCDNDIECAQGLACDDSTKRCAPIAGLTQACKYVSCDTGLFCDPSGTQAVCKSRADLAGACDYSDGCKAGLHCIAGFCRGLHPLGEACSDGAGCVAGTYCAAVQGGSPQCVAKLANGQTCTEPSYQRGSEECASTWCNPEGKCTDLGFCDVFRVADMIDL